MLPSSHLSQSETPLWLPFSSTYGVFRKGEEWREIHFGFTERIKSCPGFWWYGLRARKRDTCILSAERLMPWKHIFVRGKISYVGEVTALISKVIFRVLFLFSTSCVLVADRPRWELKWEWIGLEVLHQSLTQVWSVGHAAHFSRAAYVFGFRWTTNRPQIIWLWMSDS